MVFAALLWVRWQVQLEVIELAVRHPLQIRYGYTTLDKNGAQTEVAAWEVEAKEDGARLGLWKRLSCLGIGVGHSSMSKVQ